ncbi:MAG: glycosyltransferase family 4 protein [Terriglobia bacterium]
MGLRLLMIPKNHQYIKLLKTSLEKKDLQVVLLKPFHYSSLMNLVKMVIARVRGCQIIHVHWLYIFPFNFVMKSFVHFCRLLGIKILWEMHNIIPHARKKNDLLQSKWFFEHADCVVFHSKEDIERVHNLYATDIVKTSFVIPHGTFNGSYPNQVSKSEARKALDIPTGKRVILCFGFIRKNRGYEYLVDAIRGLKDTVVIVAGTILEKDVYQQLLQWQEEIPNLRVIGKWIPDEDLQLYFNSCDFVVLPYTEITTSGVIPLAYAFSRPVISTRIGGIAEVVNDQTGILVPPRDSISLRGAIEDLLERDHIAMGRHAYEFSERAFDWDRIATDLSDVYQRLLKG